MEKKWLWQHASQDMVIQELQDDEVEEVTDTCFKGRDCVVAEESSEMPRLESFWVQKCQFDNDAYVVLVQWVILAQWVILVQWGKYLPDKRLFRRWDPQNRLRLPYDISVRGSVNSSI